MTEQEIRAVFDELRRVGVDLERSPGLALGTGFGSGQFLPWLRALPDALGHDAFVERLRVHVASAAPISVREDSAAKAPDRSPSFFGCATLDQLEAAIDVFTREWDPLGARLGELSREDVSEHAFNVLNGILAYEGNDLEGSIAAMLGSVEEHVFGVRPSPPEQRRYLARRLMHVVREHPAPPDDDLWEAARAAAEHTTSMTVEHGRRRETVTARSNRVELGPRGDEPPALDPHAVCSQCGATGTVAVVMREAEPLLSRYCADCWRGIRDDYWCRKPPPPDTSTPEGTIAVFDYMRSMIRDRVRYSASALWADRLEFIRATLAPTDEDSPADRLKHAARLARELVDHASEMDGPMPPEIEAFVRQYAPPAA